jgi:hypothetical protein
MSRYDIFRTFCCRHSLQCCSEEDLFITREVAAVCDGPRDIYGGIRNTSTGMRFPFSASSCRSASGYARETASYVGASMTISPSRAIDVRRAAVFVTSPTAVKSL